MNQIEAIREIARPCFDKLWSQDEFAYFIEHERGVCLGGFCQGKLVGYFLSLLVQGEMDIVSVAVSAPFRRFQLAFTLIETAWELPEVESGFLEVAADNVPAIRLYEKLGFQNYGLRKKYYGGVKDAILFKKHKRSQSSP